MTRRILALVGFVLLTGWVGYAFAQDAPPATPVGLAALDTNGDGVIDSAEAQAAADANPDIGAIIANGAVVVSAIKALAEHDPATGSNATKWASVMGSILFMLVLIGRWLVTTGLGWFSRDDIKGWTIVVVLGLAGASAVFGNLVLGVSVADSIGVFLGGPFAVFLAELLKRVKPSKA